MISVLPHRGLRAAFGLLVVTLVVVCGFSSTAVASGTAPVSIEMRRALELADLGREKAELGDYRGAVRDYEAAWRLAEDPAFLFNLGVLYRELEAYPHAVARLESYLEVFPDAPNRSAVETMLITLRERRDRGWGRVSVTSVPEGADVLLVPRRGDPRVVGQTPADVWLEPGVHTLRLEMDARRSEERQVEVAIGESTSFHGDLPPGSRVDLVQNRFPEEGGASTATAGLVLLGGGLAAGIGSGILFISGASDRSDARSEEDPDRAASLQDRGDNKASLGLVLGAVGGAAIVTGIVLLLVDDSSGGGSSRASETPGTRWGFAPGPGGASLHFSGAFR